MYKNVVYFGVAGVAQEYHVLVTVNPSWIRGNYYFCFNINLGEEMAGQLPPPDLGYIYDDGLSPMLSYAETQYPSRVRNMVLVK